MEKTIKPTISFEDFCKVDMRVGKITEVIKVPKKDRLYKLIVNFGALGDRTIVSAIAQYFIEEELLGSKTLFVLNLEPRLIAGIESQGMIILSDSEDGKLFLTSDIKADEGSIVL